MNKVFFTKYLPLALLGMLLLVGLITIFTQANNYGITIDEPLRDDYGQAVLRWYTTLGKDMSFVTAYAQDAYEPEHGGGFDALIAAIQQLFPPADHWQVRRIVTALCGLAGLIVIALCGYELGGFWVAFLAALALWLYPRYYGAIYNNPKDVPAVVTTLLILWASLLLIKQWSQKKHAVRNSILVGFCLGLAASIRVTAVIWVAILGLIVLGWWLTQGQRLWRDKQVRAELLRQGIAACLIGVTALLAMMAFWPYIFINPVINLLRSIKVMSRYPWIGTVLYNGVTVSSTHLSRTYAPEWLVIGSPLPLILLAALGFTLACVLAVRTRTLDPKIGLVVLSFLVPLAAIVILHSVVYDSLRQFLFLVPSLILLAAAGLVQAVSYLGTRKQKTLRWLSVALVLLTLASYVQVVQEMITLSPFEYTYFSPVVGGLPGAAGKFDTDYWGICTKQAKDWLGSHYQQYTTIPDPSLEVKPENGPLQMPAAFHLTGNDPDFYIAYTRNNDDQLFPTYKIVHIIAAEGVPLCVIKINPSVLTTARLNIFAQL